LSLLAAEHRQMSAARVAQACARTVLKVNGLSTVALVDLDTVAAPMEAGVDAAAAAAGPGMAGVDVSVDVVAERVRAVGRSAIPRGVFVDVRPELFGSDLAGIDVQRGRFRLQRNTFGGGSGLGGGRRLSGAGCDGRDLGLCDCGRRTEQETDNGTCDDETLHDFPPEPWMGPVMGRAHSTGIGGARGLRLVRTLHAAISLSAATLAAI